MITEQKEIKNIGSLEHMLGNKLFVEHYLIKDINPLGIEAFYHRNNFV